MYEVLPSFILGFHGCDHALAEAIFAGKSLLKPSQNDYDWLGHGVYFWENNPHRAAEYARDQSRRPRGAAKIKRPAVVGARLAVQANLVRGLVMPPSQKIR